MEKIRGRGSNTNTMMRNSLVCVSVAVRDTRATQGQAWKVSRDQLLRACVPEMTGANRLVLKSEVVMILLQRAPWQQ